MYIDSAYIVKYYVHEPNSPAIREMLRKAESRASSALAIAEVHLRFTSPAGREGEISNGIFFESVGLLSEARRSLERGQLAPIDDHVLPAREPECSAAPASLYLRSGRCGPPGYRA